MATKTERAISWMEDLANDDSHGYDQAYRWGQRGDYDCSSAVISAWEAAGVPVKTSGATYTGNMYSVFTACGFEDVTDSVDLSTGAGLKRGDILLNHRNHVAMYCGNGQEVEASINEFGGVTGGQPGDQTGWEILIRSYRNYPWDCVLRYPAEYYTFYPTVCVKNTEDKQVFRVKCALKARGFYKASLNYKYGRKARAAMKKFQRAAGLRPTGNANNASNRTLFGLEMENGRMIVEECERGSQGKSVLLLKEFLTALGYYNGDLSDWYFGQATEDALKEFQRRAKLKVTGKWTVKDIEYMIG